MGWYKLYSESRLPGGQGGREQCNRVLNREGGWSPLITTRLLQQMYLFPRSASSLLRHGWILGRCQWHTCTCVQLVCSVCLRPGRGERWQIIKARRYDIVLHRRLVEDAGDTDGGLSVCFTVWISSVKVITLSLLLQHVPIDQALTPEQCSKPCFM